MADVKETKFLKIILLLMKFGARVLQYRIEYELKMQKWQKLFDFLEERKHDIFHLTSSKKCCKCLAEYKIPVKTSLHKDVLGHMYQNVEQCCLTKFRDCCCCRLAPLTDLNVTKWDITLTSCLLLKFLIKDPGQRQVIINIRNLRNDKELLHRGNAEVDDDRFEKLWLQLSNAIKEVAEKCEPYFYSEVREEVDKLKTSSLSSEDINLSVKAWKELQLQDEFGSPIDKQQISEVCQRMSQVCSDVSAITTQLQEVRFQKTELENLLDYAESQMKALEKKIYIEPKKATQHCIKHMEKHRFICLTGEAGSGKTSFGLQLMRHIKRKNQDCVPMILTESSQWFKFISSDKKFVVFVDDILGKSSVSERDFEAWRKVFDAMQLRVGDDKFPVFIIFSFRNCIWGLMKDVLKDYILFSLSKTSHVDLSGSDFGMTFQEKKSMLHRFCDAHKISVCESEDEENRSFEAFDPGALCLCEETLNNIAKLKTTSGFPLLCEEFFSNPESLKQGSNFFKIYSALNHFKKKVDDLLCKEMYLQYVLLVLFFLEVLTDRAYTMQEIMKLKSKIREISTKIDLFNCVSHQMNKAKIQGSLRNMQNTFIQIVDEQYKLKHMVVYEAVLLSFGESFPSSFLELVNKNDVFTYVRSHKYKPEKWEICVHLEDDMTKSLAKKLIDVYAPKTADAYTDVYKHPSFNDGQLVSCFLDIVEKDAEFRAFLDSFVAGACNYKKDKLASESIKRFSSLFKFDFQIFYLILNHDLFDTFHQFINDPEFRKLLMAHLLKGDYHGGALYNASLSGARKCFLGMLGLLHNRDDDLETDGDSQVALSTEAVKDLIPAILSHHNEAVGADWREALTKLVELLPSETDKQEVYADIIKNSLIVRKFSIAQEYLQLIVYFSTENVMSIIHHCMAANGNEFLNVFCKKLKALNFVMGSMLPWYRCLVVWITIYGNENLVMMLLHEFNDQFDYKFDLSGSTILHIFEGNHFSDANLLFILQRPEGEFMFTSVNSEGLTPVQCRESYLRVKRFWSTCIWGQDRQLFSRLERFLSMRGECRVVRRYPSMENLCQYSHYVTGRKDFLAVRFNDDMQLLC